MTISRAIPDEVSSPFGGAAKLEARVDARFIQARYFIKCGLDVAPFLRGTTQLGVYSCALTGYRFWRPVEVAGGEAFYAQVSSTWPNYYREERWEHSIARRFLQGRQGILEAGCGAGSFLRTIEGVVPRALGIDFNPRASEQPKTAFPIINIAIEDVAQLVTEPFDAVCAFQVLEHLPDPARFIRDAIRVLKPGGILVISTPNSLHPTFASREDALDLPPHHMGHFSPQVFRKIADLFQLEIVHLEAQSRSVEVPKATEATGASLSFAIARFLTRAALRISFALNNEPGENVIAVLRKM